MTPIRILQILVTSAFVLLGLAHAHMFWRALEPATSFVELPGRISDVIKHTDSSSGVVEHFAEVKFEYEVEGQRFVSNRLSPLCTLCEPSVVLDAIGFRPSLVPAGLAVKVFALRKDPSIAYLALPSRKELRQHGWLSLLWLFGAPLFMFLVLGHLGKNQQSAD
jgi:hypothetical protein